MFIGEGDSFSVLKELETNLGYLAKTITKLDTWISLDKLHKFKPESVWSRVADSWRLN